MYCDATVGDLKPPSDSAVKPNQTKPNRSDTKKHCHTDAKNRVNADMKIAQVKQSLV